MKLTSTHAWFPKAMFDETLNETGDGTWLFGRKRDGFVALYSARQVDWKSSDPFKDKEVLAEGGATSGSAWSGTRALQPSVRP